MKPSEHDPDLNPIPEIFFSAETGRMFSNCSLCNRSLMASDLEYVIQKHFVRDEVVFEIALCNDCTGRSFLSEESQQQLAQFVEPRQNACQRTVEPFERNQNLSDWIERCLTCNQPKSDLQEFSLIADCAGPDIIYFDTPVLICEKCIEAMQNCLSDSTREFWNDWIENHIDCPPALNQSLREKGPLLV